MRQVLVENQKSICLWCERKVELESSSIEHIANRDHYPKLTFEATNLAASCKDDATCNSAHRNLTLPEWVHPYNNSNLQKEFNYEADGKIAASETCQNNDEATETINSILNLNTVTLKSTRARTISDLEEYVAQEFSLEEIIDLYNYQFVSTIEEWFEIYSD